MMMKFGKSDAMKQVLGELNKYLDKEDGDELGSILKPKKAEVSVTKIEGAGDDGEMMPEEAMEMASTGPEAGAPHHEEMPMGGDGAKMSEEELEEMIQAIQAKLGAQ